MPSGTIKRIGNSIAYRVVHFLLRRGLLEEKGLKALFYRFGFHLLRHNYYLPIPQKADLSFQTHSKLVGIDTNDGYSLLVIETVFNRYKAELDSFPLHGSDNSGRFYWINGSFMAIDGNAYYSFIRHLKPGKVVEIGSGNSTLLASAAIEQNYRETGTAAKLICIEPYPNTILTGGLLHLYELKSVKVQEVDLEFFESLQANDILFIDSTHVLTSGGDVWWEYCEILPRLKSGVYVHIHDISLPKPYPDVYFKNDLYWNEQYLLQAFLTYNARFEVVWAGNYMIHNYPEKVKSSFLPEYDAMRSKYPFSEPSSLWMRVK